MTIKEEEQMFQWGCVVRWIRLGLIPQVTEKQSELENKTKLLLEMKAELESLRKAEVSQNKPNFNTEAGAQMGGVLRGGVSPRPRSVPPTDRTINKKKTLNICAPVLNKYCFHKHFIFW